MCAAVERDQGRATVRYLCLQWKLSRMTSIWRGCEQVSSFKSFSRTYECVIVRKSQDISTRFFSIELVNTSAERRDERPTIGLIFAGNRTCYGAHHDGKQENNGGGGAHVEEDEDQSAFRLSEKQRVRRCSSLRHARPLIFICLLLSATDVDKMLPMLTSTSDSRRNSK